LAAGHILQDNGSESALTHPVTCQKSFGETFGVATGVSDPSYRKSRYETTTQAAKPPL
jgi:hypothetical protein